MPQTVELYETAYGHFAEEALAQVRRETYGDDFGQSSWVTADEYWRFFRLLRLDASDHVLDIGSGSGGPALFLAREVGCRVTGIDVDAAGLRTAMGLLETAGVGDRVEFQWADACERLPFEDGSFDAVLCMDAICHMPGRARVVAEWLRVLRPGGRVLFTDPVVLVGPVTKEEVADRSSTGPFEFSSPGVNERLLIEAGFEWVAAHDATENAAEVSRRWHDARETRRVDLEELEGERTFVGLQRFLDAVHRLSAERRMLRTAYLAHRA
jgi:SAM-dependent methyltransferase